MEAAAPLVALTGAHPTLTGDIHVTLCFLGSVDDSQLAALCARAAAVRAARFTLQFDRIEFWRGSRVLVAGCAHVPAEGAALGRSLQQAASALGLAPDLKPWRPHVTLARAASSRRLPAGAAGERALSAPLVFTASRFWLAHSLVGTQSQRYATLASWPLAA